MKARSIVAAGVVSATGLTLLVCGWNTQTADALPTFAQAYGVDCSACHTSIPALNAYGRYVQST
ncbi:MAG: hypothetical protein JOZ24_02555, partial [Candidatus Eremiobacteraeota bacterium]|nr:hypothetical protein [Candidatus Eremiobacteraeota bacterium]